MYSHLLSLLPSTNVSFGGISFVLACPWRQLLITKLWFQTLVQNIFHTQLNDHIIYHIEKPLSVTGYLIFAMLILFIHLFATNLKTQ